MPRRNNEQVRSEKPAKRRYKVPRPRGRGFNPNALLRKLQQEFSEKENEEN